MQRTRLRTLLGQHAYSTFHNSFPALLSVSEVRLCFPSVNAIRNRYYGTPAVDMLCAIPVEIFQ